mmetsp:Transcript_36818/g.41431  ORF Transcript_36818/g.41431 Transcript_36818/m.41431 type:complete len:319 (+) Transcript_36818:26-982(+)
MMYATTMQLKNKKKKKKKKQQQTKKKKLHRCVPTTRVTRVTFSKKVRVRKIARLSDMDSQDKHATYYSHDEMVQTRNMLRATIRVINEDYQQQRRSKRNTTTRELDSTQQTQSIEKDITIKNEKEQKESDSLFCAAYNDKNCDCCRAIIQNNNNNNDCSDEDDDDQDQDQNESSGENNYYQWHENTFCLRGLEVEFPTGKQRRRRNKTIARDMVFEEQRYYNMIKTKYNTSPPPPTTTSNGNNKNGAKGQQQELEETEKKDGKAEIGIEVEDPVMAIAEVYRIESIPALQRALEIGKNDEFIAHCIYNHNQQEQEQEQ